MISHSTMTTRMFLRRLAVIGAVVVSLSVAGLAVRAAAAWTASSAPPTVAPVSATQLSRQLADEQARSAALDRQLTAMSDQMVQLSAALTMATDRMTTDATNAKELRAKLLAARRNHDKVQASDFTALTRRYDELRQQEPAGAAQRAALGAPAPARSAGGSRSAASGVNHDEDHDDG